MKQKYAVVFEQTPSNYSAYVPDLPGYVSTGESLEDTHRTIREAITFHIVDMLAHGESLPEPRMSLEQAEDLHNDVLAEYGGDTSAVFHDVELKLPAKFGMVQVEGETSPSGLFKPSAQPTPREDSRCSRYRDPQV